MKRAFIALVWGIADTRFHGPFDTNADARSWAEDEVREAEGIEHGAVLGPFPIAYLSEEPEVAHALQATSVEQLAEVIDQAVTFAVNDGGIEVKQAVLLLDRTAGDWAENLQDGAVPLTASFGQTLASRFRPSELLALYEECKREAQDEGDDAKMVYIREAYAKLTGVEL